MSAGDRPVPGLRKDGADMHLNQDRVAQMSEERYLEPVDLADPQTVARWLDKELCKTDRVERVLVAIISRYGVGVLVGALQSMELLCEARIWDEEL